MTKVTVDVDGEVYVVKYVIRDWNPLPGVDLEKYPLPKGQVCECFCEGADNMVTWAPTLDEALGRMKERIRRWKQRQKYLKN